MRGDGRSNGAGGRMGLPPGPRMPSALQAVGWARRPYPLMKRFTRLCHYYLGAALGLVVPL